MNISIHNSKNSLGLAAGNFAAEKISSAIQENGQANIILATGASQFETLKSLVAHSEIDWSTVTMFHLDEYIGLPMSHEASFRNYLQERFVSRIPELKAVHFVNGDTGNPQKECERLNEILVNHAVDVALVGFGENGHLAFNDPPADFETDRPYIIVDLDEACRRQQLGEGWFRTFEEVPVQAISMSVQQILKSRTVISSVPDRRKAEAVKGALEGGVDVMCPTSILQTHPDCHVFLDEDSAALLRQLG
jgi:glucosamine-6-phosphate deaminase